MMIVKVRRFLLDSGLILHNKVLFPYDSVKADNVVDEYEYDQFHSVFKIQGIVVITLVFKFCEWCEITCHFQSSPNSTIFKSKVKSTTKRWSQRFYIIDFSFTDYPWSKNFLKKKFIFQYQYNLLFLPCISVYYSPNNSRKHIYPLKGF